MDVAPQYGPWTSILAAIMSLLVSLASPVPATASGEDACATWPTLIMTVGGDSAIDEATGRTIAERVEAYSGCPVDSALQADGTVVLTVPTEDGVVTSTYNLLEPGVMTLHLVVGELLPGETPPPGTRQAPFEDDTVLILEEEPALPRGGIVDLATPDIEFGEWVVDFAFNEAAGQAFAEVTAANIGSRLAILLDDRVLIAPIVQTAILGGQGRITGHFTEDEARSLAARLSVGPLPDGLQLQVIRTGPPAE